MMSRNGSIPAIPVGRAKGDARKAMKVNAQSFWPDGKNPSAAHNVINFHGRVHRSAWFQRHGRAQDLDTWKWLSAGARTTAALCMESLTHRIAYAPGSVKETGAPNESLQKIRQRLGGRSSLLSNP